MPRKKKRRGRGKPRPTFPARFAVGDRVRGKPGIKDPDFPDIPLGGWAGTVSEVDRRSNPPTYLIEWDQHTLDNMHPVYRRRCERDDLGVESLWLGEADIDPDTGGPAVMEQPTNIVTRPLRLHDQDDRIRAVFGLTSDDPLPPASLENLRRYHRHLASHLAFPFPAQLTVFTGPFQEEVYRVNVLGLLDAEDGDEDEGLRCEVELQGEFTELPLADLEAPLPPPTRQLVEDYSYWFGNWPADDFPAAGGAGPMPLETYVVPPGKWDYLKNLITYGLYGVAYGVVLGALLNAVEATRTGALVGAALVGTVGLVAGAKYGRLVGVMNRVAYGSLVGGALGTVAGVLAGALIGAMVVAVLGTAGGGIVGAIAGRVVKRNAAGTWVGAVIGAGVGAVGLAYYRDQEAALAGAIHGAWMGAATAVLLVFVWLGALILAGRNRRLR